MSAPPREPGVLIVIFSNAEKPGRSRGFEPYAGWGERPGRIERTPAQRSDSARSEAGRRREAGRGGSEKGGGSGQLDPLTVISPSPRKSPGEAGALSLTPDGVSDPAEGATAQPSEAIPPVAKQGGDAKQGKRERTRRGKRTV